MEKYGEKIFNILSVFVGRFVDYIFKKWVNMYYLFYIFVSNVLFVGVVDVCVIIWFFVELVS